MAAQTAVAFTKYAELLEAGHPAAPDQRKQLMDAVIAPALSRAGFESPEAARCLASACGDPWSTIRKTAIQTAVAARTMTTPGTADNTAAFHEAAYAPAKAFAASGAGAATWFAVHGAVELANAVSPALAEGDERDEIVTSVTLAAVAHPQLPVREAAVRHVARFASPACVESAVLPAVQGWLAIPAAGGDILPSEAIQGALALGAAMPRVAEAILADAVTLTKLAAADDAAIRQHVAALLAPVQNERFLFAWLGDARFGAALSLLDDRSWAALETGLLAVDATLTAALRLANSTTGGAHPYASPVTSGENGVTPGDNTAPETATLRRIAGVVRRVAELTSHERFETKRMAEQVAPLIAQYAVRRFRASADAVDDMPGVAEALATQGVLRHAAYFSLLRSVLDHISGLKFPAELDALLDAGCRVEPGLAFARSVYQRTVLGRDVAFEVPRQPAPRSQLQASQLACYALLDAARLDPTTTAAVLPAFFDVDGGASGFCNRYPVNCQSAVLAATECVFACAAPTVSTSAVLDTSAELAEDPSMSSGGTPQKGGLVHIKSFHAKTHRRVFGFVDHSDFEAAELLDGGADVQNGRAWLKASERRFHKSASPTGAGSGAAFPTHDVVSSPPYANRIIPVVADVIASRGTEARVVHHARHVVREAHGVAQIVSSEWLAALAVRRLDEVARGWREPESPATKAAASESDDWDASSEGEGDAADSGVSLAQELAAAAKMIAGIDAAALTDAALMTDVGLIRRRG